MVYMLISEARLERIVKKIAIMLSPNTVILYLVVVLQDILEKSVAALQGMRQEAIFSPSGTGNYY